MSAPTAAGTFICTLARVQICISYAPIFSVLLVSPSVKFLILRSNVLMSTRFKRFLHKNGRDNRFSEVCKQVVQNSHIASCYCRCNCRNQRLAAVVVHFMLTKSGDHNVFHLFLGHLNHLLLSFQTSILLIEVVQFSFKLHCVCLHDL